MKAWTTLVVVVLLGLLVYVGSGPYRTWRHLREAVAAQDAVALSEDVDFPALRTSVKAQLDDAMVRKAGAGVQSSLLGGIALTLGRGVVDGLVDVMVSPGGIGGLMRGHALWRSARDSFGDPRERQPVDGPLRKASCRFESASRFTATVPSDAGEPVVFVLRREGLDWKLVDIRLPL